MKARKLHRWDVTPAEARRIQEKLRGRVELEDRIGTETWRHREKKENRKEKIEKRPEVNYAHAIAAAGVADGSLSRSIRTVAGTDVAFEFRGRGTSRGRSIAGVIV